MVEIAIGIGVTRLYLLSSAAFPYSSNIASSCKISENFPQDVHNLIFFNRKLVLTLPLCQMEER